MKKTNLLMVAMLFSAVLMSGICHAAEPKEPKLVKETKFDKKIMKFADDVVVTGNELIFLDKDGNIRKKRYLPEHTELGISNDGKRIGQLTAYDITEKGPGRTEFMMLNENGDTLWQTEKLGSTVFHVSQAQGGSVIERQCFEGGCGNKIVFFDRDNTKGRVITPTVGAKAESIGGALSDDGNYFVASFRTFDEPQPDGSSDLVYFDVMGKQLWTKHFANKRIGKIALSFYGNVIAAEIRDIVKKECHIEIYNKQGDSLLKQHVDYVGNYALKFDENGKYLLAGSSKGKLYFLDTTLAMLLWERSTGDENTGFFDGDISSGFIVTSVIRRAAQKESEALLPKYIFVYDRNGDLLLQKTFLDHGLLDWSKGPRVKFKESGKKIVVIFPNKLIELENEFAK